MWLDVGDNKEVSHVPIMVTGDMVSLTEIYGLWNRAGFMKDDEFLLPDGCLSTYPKVDVA